MNPEKQRIAIAEACPDSFWIWVSPINGRKAPFRKGDHPSHCDHEVEFLTDLNAMHEAEKVLTAEQRERYAKTLYRLPAFDTLVWHDETQYDVLFTLIHATAARRAEAFLRTIGKWEESS